jgi:hypothetical protein
MSMAPYVHWQDAGMGNRSANLRKTSVICIGILPAVNFAVSAVLQSEPSGEASRKRRAVKIDLYPISRISHSADHMAGFTGRVVGG